MSCFLFSWFCNATHLYSFGSRCFVSGLFDENQDTNEGVMKGLFSKAFYESLKIQTTAKLNADGTELCDEFFVP